MPTLSICKALPWWGSHPIRIYQRGHLRDLGLPAPWISPPLFSLHQGDHPTHPIGWSSYGLYPNLQHPDEVRMVLRTGLFFTHLFKLFLLQRSPTLQIHPVLKNLLPKLLICTYYVYICLHLAATPRLLPFFLQRPNAWRMNWVFLTLKPTPIYSGCSELHHRLPPCEDSATGIGHPEPLMNIPATVLKWLAQAQPSRPNTACLSFKLQICFAKAKFLDVLL